jgi:1-acyl-sn-glycerol-3-phosphate acyltransferase
VVIFSSPSFKEGEFAFTDGIIRLAQAARVPILPVALKNCGAVLPLGKLLFQPGTVKLYFGEPAMYRSADDLKSVIAGLYSCL